MEYNELEFRQTSPACPEQYDVFNKENEQVGYVRLRWGVLRCDYPKCGARTIYEFVFPDKTDGSFLSEEQRAKYLDIIAGKIKAHEVSM